MPSSRASSSSSFFSARTSSQPPSPVPSPKPVVAPENSGDGDAPAPAAAPPSTPVLALPQPRSSASLRTGDGGGGGGESPVADAAGSHASQNPLGVRSPQRWVGSLFSSSSSPAKRRRGGGGEKEKESGREREREKGKDEKESLGASSGLAKFASADVDDDEGDGDDWGDDFAEGEDGEDGFSDLFVGDEGGRGVGREDTSDSGGGASDLLFGDGGSGGIQFLLNSGEKVLGWGRGGEGHSGGEGEGGRLESGGGVIGIYADPSAEKDDWADDFQLDKGLGISRSKSGDDINSAVMSLLAKKVGKTKRKRRRVREAKGSGSDEFHSIDESSTLFSGVGGGAGGGGGTAAVGGETVVTGDDSGGLRPILVGETEVMKRPPEKIDVSAAGEAVRYGDEPGEVPSSCRHFLNICSRHLVAIETHLERLREDTSSMLALEAAAENVYSFTFDVDATRVAAAAEGLRELDMDCAGAPGGSLFGPAASLAPSFGLGGGEELSIALDYAVKDVLLWKLEYARLCEDGVGTARALIGVARYEREYGRCVAAIEMLESARAELESASGGEVGLGTLRIEAQYELALTQRRKGDLDAAVATFSRAIDMSMALAAREDDTDGCDATEQRGLWWALECRYMLAESFYEQARFTDAATYYVEYAMRSLLRMIGLIVPSSPEQKTAGRELMRYCLFSPRRLALSVWSAALCLAELGVIEAAANFGSMAMRTATALGIEDVRVATVEFCGRVNDALRSAKRQTFLSTSNRTDGGGGEATDNDFWPESGDVSISRALASGDLDAGGRASSILRDFDADLTGNEMVGMEEDWDTQIAREMHITIQRCSEVTTTYGATLFTPGKVKVGAAGSLETANQSSKARIGQQESGSAVPGTDGKTWGHDANSAANDLVESELMQYLNSLSAAAGSMSAQPTMYPKPTEPFRTGAFGPKEHESFLRNFVLCRKPPPGYETGCEESALDRMYSRPPSKVPTSRHTSFQALSESADEPSIRNHPALPRMRGVNASGAGGLGGIEQPPPSVRRCSIELQGVDRSSFSFSRVHQQSVWNVLQSPGDAASKRQQVRALVNSAFHELSSLPAIAGTVRGGKADNDPRAERMAMVSSLLEILKMSRELLDRSGKDAAWFARASTALATVAATVSPAAKAVVELFQAESRAHLGVVRVTAPALLDLCSSGLAASRLPTDDTMMLGTSSEIASPLFNAVGNGTSHATDAMPSSPPTSQRPPKAPVRPIGALDDGAQFQQQSAPFNKRVPPELGVSIVDVLHSLYWRTKAGVDDSLSAVDSLERMVHADVCATLYLVGCGVSPVSGTAIDLAKEEAVLHLEQHPSGLVDDTRRVNGPQLVADLQEVWTVIPASAPEVRARVCLALAHHIRVEMHDMAYTERLLFDGLVGLHDATPDNSVAKMPRPLLCSLSQPTPMGAVASPLAGALLYEYGTVCLRRSKYRYGIAALEAAVDGRKARDPNALASVDLAHEVSAIARSHFDWRRALSWLYDLRSDVHPMNGRRNDFIHLCLLLYMICSDAGFFDAALLPVRAYSALIYEERLRVLLDLYKERLEKRRKSRRRYQLAASALPLFPSRSAKAMSLHHSSARSNFRSAIPPSRAHVADSTQSESGVGDFDEEFGVGGMNNRRSSALISPSRARKRNQTWSNKAAHVMMGLGKRSGLKGAAQMVVATVSSSGSLSRDKFPKKEKSPAANPGSPPGGSSPEFESRESDKRPRFLFAKRHAANVRLDNMSSSTCETDEFKFETEREELFSIAEEQAAAVADGALFEVEFVKAKLAFDRGDFSEAERMCSSLKDMASHLHRSKYFVLEIMALIRLKRREITRCLEIVDAMEMEAQLVATSASPFRDHSRSNSHSNESATFSFQLGRSRMPSHELDDANGFRDIEVEADNILGQAPTFLPEVSFLRLSALFHGGRLSEALSYADEVLERCPETQLWHRAKLHYMRGKVMFAMCSQASAPFDGEDVPTVSNFPVDPVVDMQVLNLTMSAFETASSFYDAAGDEVGVVKSDMWWAQAAIDVLFRRVVLSRNVDGTGGEVSVDEACRLVGRTIIFSELEDVVHSNLAFLSEANLPLLTIDGLAALAELKCIAGEPSVSWCMWVAEAWKLFSRLYTDPEEYTVVLTMAPVSTLMRLKSLCGRLVRLILCYTHAANVEGINRHLGIFEAYVTLQVDIDRRMNLASKVHSGREPSSSMTAGGKSKSGTGIAKAGVGERSSNGGADIGGESSDDGAQEGETEAFTADPSQQQKKTEFEGSVHSTGTNVDDRNRPAGAFLHVIGDEGVALGRQGFTVLINRPRQQVMNAVKESGAVLVPRNLLGLGKKSQRESATDRAVKQNEDVEFIFPFDDRAGLGAMYILDDAVFQHKQKDGEIYSAAPSVVSAVSASSDRDRAFASAAASGAEESTGTTPIAGAKRPYGPENACAEDWATGVDGGCDSSAGDAGNALSTLVETVRSCGLREVGGGETECLGETAARKVWAHMHRIEVETRRYSRGEITLEELGHRNGSTVKSWLRCMPRSRREWSVPESLGKRLVYILYAHGVLGYYCVDRGSCVSRVEFGGKQAVEKQVVKLAASVVGSSNGIGGSFVAGDQVEDGDVGGVGATYTKTGTGNRSSTRMAESPRPPNKAERNFLYSLVKDGRSRGNAWYKTLELESVNGLASAVLQTPRTLLETCTAGIRSRAPKNRPVVLIADLTLQIFPWELFLDHVVIRSLSLLHSIRGFQDNSFKKYNQEVMQEAMQSPTVALSRPIVRFMNFQSPRREVGDLERSEEARRQQLAFQSILRLNHLSPPRLIAYLELGGFSDPTALNAVARPTGPLSTPLTRSKRAVRLLGIRLEARVGRKNYSQLEFVKVPGLGSASTADLSEAAMVTSLVPASSSSGGSGLRRAVEKWASPSPSSKKSVRSGSSSVISSGNLEPRKELGAYIGVFLFTYADLVDVTESVFGLLRAVPRGIVIFAPANKMKVVARHLEDEELEAELQTASGRRSGRIVPDVGGSARVVVEYVSRFARSKCIAIVVFLGEGLVEIWPQKRRRVVGNGRANVPVVANADGRSRVHLNRVARRG